jgi:formylglycine-generating enzyme required for sulfatase activity
VNAPSAARWILIALLPAACGRVRAQEHSTPPSAAVAAPEGMVWIPGASFAMGCDEGAPNERPVHQVKISGFFLERTEVTNADFARFVEATGFVTFAERAPTESEMPGTRAADRVPGGLVFQRPAESVGLEDWSAWWRFVPGASWRHPTGPDSSIEDRMDHPVVQVSWQDACAYAKWKGRRLPTEAEWEFAARGGLVSKPFVSGDELAPGGKWSLNIWQGAFPRENRAADGFATTAPVGSFAPNGYGLTDMAGNVWEWCSDHFAEDTYVRRAGSPVLDPRGPRSGNERVQRGGSYLCSDIYCTGYRPSARMHCDEHTSLCHTGFRCAADAR